MKRFYRAAWLAPLIGFCNLLSPATAYAASNDAETEEEEAVTPDADKASDGEEAAETDTPTAVKESATGASPSTSVAEVKDQSYYFVGARYRIVVVPKFIINLFAEGGDTAVAQQPGVEFGIRSNGFEYSIFGMLGFYGLQSTPFRGKSDPLEAWEMVKPDFKILYLGSDFMWSTQEFAPGLSFHYGAGIGIGVVFGNLGRQQAYPLNGKTNDPAAYRACTGVNNPDPRFCGSDTNHYGSYSEKSPSPLFPWIAGQVGLRYKIHPRFVMRLDAGIMVPGAFIGLGADYGL